MLLVFQDLTILYYVVFMSVFLFVIITCLNMCFFMSVFLFVIVTCLKGIRQNLVMLQYPKKIHYIALSTLLSESLLLLRSALI